MWAHTILCSMIFLQKFGVKSLGASLVTMLWAVSGFVEGACAYVGYHSQGEPIGVSLVGYSLATLRELVTFLVDDVNAL